MKPDFVVKSPGIPDSSQVIKSYKKNNINVISEIEFASRHTDSEIVAITGSNGKTTTTLLTHQILNDEGLNVTIGGNIGTSFSSLLISNDYNYLVLEVSSFQLDGIVEFKPHIAVITNLSPDHLDRYKNYEDYIKSKFRIVMNQNSNDYFKYHHTPNDTFDKIIPADMRYLTSAYATMFYLASEIPINYRK